MCCEVRHGLALCICLPFQCQLYKCCHWSQACSFFMQVGVWWTVGPMCVPTQLLLQGPHLRLPEHLRISDSCQHEEKDLSGPRWFILYEENAQEKDHLMAGETSLWAPFPRLGAPPGQCPFACVRMSKCGLSGFWLAGSLGVCGGWIFVLRNWCM